MDDLRMNQIMMRDNRYDAVLHLVTAADGAIEAYGGQNNEARHEGAQEAIERDNRIQAAYMGHKNFCLIDNSHKDFQAKINAAKQ